MKLINNIKIAVLVLILSLVLFLFSLGAYFSSSLKSVGNSNTLKEITIASVALLVMPKAIEVALENIFDYDTTLTAN